MENTKYNNDRNIYRGELIPKDRGPPIQKYQNLQRVSKRDKGLLESGEHAILSFAMFEENPSRSNLSCGFYIIVAGLLFLHAAKFNTDCRPGAIRVKTQCRPASVVENRVLVIPTFSILASYKRPRASKRQSRRRYEYFSMENMLSAGQGLMVVPIFLIPHSPSVEDKRFSFSDLLYFFCLPGSPPKFRHRTAVSFI
ncbi:predicted protein [Histoplasma capsulatum G186AR]|uniref:Uncharacterized protein n=1 Tax=Ajellomyces capsulatus (strain G186AR / H82 / ATCC MYA-2454 / RMSCC 2432) TaxID=447093 RepID=C0NI00_AJECG|nr:uncharacterized protein HCBG_02972 [Histoplasma capsulatum G186AR]EEH09435.1 predicted protein [Histoplasma capsulatum G186AR]